MAFNTVRMRPNHKWTPRPAFRSIASGNTKLLADQAEFFAGWMWASINLMEQKGLPREMADTLYRDAERAFLEYRSLPSSLVRVAGRPVHG